MIKMLFKIQRLRNDARAASRGPEALGRRLTERAVHRLVHKLLG